jgi:glycosyltransferase involved in cell wall biosynthesis
MKKTYNRIFTIFSQSLYFIKEKILYFLNKKKLKILLDKKNPLVSIILPTYNRSEMLKTRSIRSILKQSYSNFELLVISDGSTDNTEEIVNSFNDSRIKFFKILRNKKRYPETAINHWFAGPVLAINHGLSKTKGDWIARLDDDDIWSKNHLKYSLEALYQSKSEFCSSKRFELKDGTFKVSNYKAGDYLQGKNRGIKIGGVNTWVYAGYLKFMKANINCWRKEYNKVNDTDLCDRMMRLGVTTHFIDKCTQIGLPRNENGLYGSKYYLMNEKEILDKYNIK